MTETNEPPVVRRPLTAAQTAFGILLTISLVVFAGSWMMFAGMMERTVELKRILSEVAVLRAQVEVLTHPAPGPIETGGALVLTDPPPCEGSRL